MVSILTKNKITAVTKNIFDGIDDVFIDELDTNEIQDEEFSPFNSVSYDHKNKILNIDDSYLEGGIHIEPDWPKITAKWSPTLVKDYSLVNKLYLDIETTGLDPNRDRTTIIGLKVNKEFKCNDINSKALDQLKQGILLVAEKPNDDESEAFILRRVVKALKVLNPHIISMHNGVEFDFPFMKKRMDILNVRHNINILSKPRIMASASLNGRPIKYLPIYLRAPNQNGYVFNDGTFPQIIDTMHLSCQLDKILAIYKNHKLKYLAHLMGAKEDEKPSLEYEQIRDYWFSEDPEKLELLFEYAHDDLIYQEAVSDYLIPALWYQQMFFPMAIQDLSLASPPLKWNSLLKNYYRRYNNQTLPNGQFYTMPETDEKYHYEGALVGCNPGIYKNYFKIDVSSLYPSIILKYGLARKKDPMCLAEVVLQAAKDIRMIFKNIASGEAELIEQTVTSALFKEIEGFFGEFNAENIPKELKKKIKSTDKSTKVLLNGYYGGLGAKFHKYNDMEAAALTTAYGRVFMRMMKEVCDRYATIINIDTDGLCLSPKKLLDIKVEYLQNEIINPKTNEAVNYIDSDNPNYINPEYVWASIQNLLPTKIKIDLEYKEIEGVMFASKRKNYIYWKNVSDDPSKVGIYRKRNRTKLQQELPIKYVHAFAFMGKDEAEEYIDELRGRINYTEFDVHYDPRNIPQDLLKFIVQTHKIPTSDVMLTKFGLGNHGDIVSYFWGGMQGITATGKISKKIHRFPVKVIQDDFGEYKIYDKQNDRSLDEVIADPTIYLQVNMEFYGSEIDKLKNEIDGISTQQEIRESFIEDLFALDINMDVFAAIAEVSMPMFTLFIERLNPTINDCHKVLLKEIKKPKKKSDKKDESKADLKELKVEETEDIAFDEIGNTGNTEESDDMYGEVA